MTNVIVTAEAFVDAIIEKGVLQRAIMLGDETFSFPLPKYVTGTYSDWLSKRLLGRPYIKQAYDCENFALEAVAEACEAHRLSVMSGDAEPSGIAFGELWIRSLSHAICFAAHGTSQKIEIVAYEPQVSTYKGRIIQASMRVVKLTPADWQSVILAKAQ